MISYTFNLNNIEPIPKQSVKYNRKTKTWYAPPAGKKYQAKIRNLIQAKMNARKLKMIPKGKDIKLIIYFFRKSKTRCDIDNLIKPTMDAMRGIVFPDDDQVKQLEIYKYIGQDHPGVYITVRVIPPLKKRPGD